MIIIILITSVLDDWDPYADPLYGHGNNFGKTRPISAKEQVFWANLDTDKKRQQEEDGQLDKAEKH